MDPRDRQFNRHMLRRVRRGAELSAERQRCRAERCAAVAARQHRPPCYLMVAMWRYLTQWRAPRARQGPGIAAGAHSGSQCSLRSQAVRSAAS